MTICFSAFNTISLPSYAWTMRGFTFVPVKDGAVSMWEMKPSAGMVVFCPTPDAP